MASSHSVKFTWVIIIIAIASAVIVICIVIVVVSERQLWIVQRIFICIRRSVCTSIIVFCVSQNIRRTIWIRANILHSRKGHIHDRRFELICVLFI